MMVPFRSFVALTFDFLDLPALYMRENLAETVVQVQQSPAATRCRSIRRLMTARPRHADAGHRPGGFCMH